jgi:small-conductance mechanosensitive channel/CRP-like cAMP-binding protein
MLAARLLSPSTHRVRYGAVVVFLAIAAAGFLGRQLISWPGGRSVSTGFIAFGYSLALARLFFLVIFDGLIRRSRREPLPRILRDISQGVLFFVALLLALNSAGVEPGQLLTTSALLTVVAGMALQETLGNLVAGLALQGERPFDVGDWIEVHGTPSHIGRVREINWRATRLHTLDNVDLIVPNGLLAKALVTNFDRPHRAARRSVFFTTALSAPPRKVHELVLSAITEVPGVLASPSPSIVTFDFSESGVKYWLRFFIDDMGRRDAIDGGVRDRVWYALDRAGMSLSVPSRTIEMYEVSEETKRLVTDKKSRERIEALANNDLFSKLAREDLELLGANARTALFAPGEVIIRRGDFGDTMFVVKSGELAVRVDAGGTETEAARLGAGAFFGEMSLLTGDTRQATVVAVSSCELLVIDHAAFSQVLASHPEVAKIVGEKVIERRRGLADALVSASMKQEALVEQHDLIDRIKNFFRL